MPASQDHVALAKKNRSALEYLRLKIDDYPEWVVTVAFYEALHHIEAAMACDTSIQRTSGHKERHDAIRNHKEFKKIYAPYKNLFDASCIARYMGNGTVSFSNYMKTGQIETIVIGTWLHKIKIFTEAQIAKAQMANKP